MVTPELTDRQLNADLSRSLRFSTLVTPIQQQNAKARLLECAAQQIMLPPLEAAERAPSLRDHADSLRHRTVRLFNLLVTDLHAYERAHRPPCFYQFYNPHGRHLFTIIHMSA